MSTQDGEQITTARARVPLIRPRGVIGRLYSWYVRKEFGAELEPGQVLAHHRQVLRISAIQEAQLAKLRGLDPTIASLAQMRAAATIECSWCLDFGYWLGHHQGVDPAKIEAVAHWRDAEVYSDPERRVLAYAEAMTSTPPAVDDAMVAALRTDLGDESFVALTYLIAVENQRSRINSALGLASQGFSESCRIPTR